MWRIRHALEQSGRLRALPALVRDSGASVLVLVAFAAAAELPLIEVPAVALVLLPVLLLAAVAFGRDSAVLAALLTALVAQSPLFGSAESSVGLLTVAALSGATLVVAALLEELRRSLTEAETAHLRSDFTARRAAERVEAARRQLRDAEARLAEVERKAQKAGPDLRAPTARVGNPDPGLESALRSEGGV